MMAEHSISGIITAVLACGILSAEHLPVEPVTVAQGLASNTIHKIVRDSRGFLWFCTGAGLSRFDGHQFVNFGPSQGFPGQVVWDFHEARSGDYWVATGGGLVRLASSAVEAICSKETRRGVYELRAEELHA